MSEKDKESPLWLNRQGVWRDEPGEVGMRQCMKA